MKLVFPRLAIAVLLIALSFTVPATDSALAQNAYSDAKLESFVEAAVQVENLMREYDPQIKAAETSERADTLRAEAGAKMEAAIDQTPDISVEEYSQIVMAARQDQALNERVNTIFRATTGQ